MPAVTLENQQENKSQTEGTSEASEADSGQESEAGDITVSSGEDTEEDEIETMDITIGDASGSSSTTKSSSRKSAKVYEEAEEDYGEEYEEAGEEYEEAEEEYEEEYEEEAEDYGEEYEEEDIDTSDIGTDGRLNIHKYVTSVELRYQPAEKEGTDEWTTFYSSTDPDIDNVNLAGDDTIRLDVIFESVPLEELIAANGLMEYTIPAELRDPQIPETTFVDSNGATAGKYWTEDGLYIIQYDMDWLEDMLEQAKASSSISPSLSSNFWIESYLNLSEIKDDTPHTVIFGDNVAVELNFESDLYEKYATLNVTKNVATKVEETENGDFLTYQITAAAGVDGCPDVHLEDVFTKGNNYVKEYVGITTSETTLSSTSTGDAPTEIGAPSGKEGKIYLDSSGQIIWDIGDMEAGESRTLTYKIQLESGYTGEHKSKLTNNGVITNQVTPYLGTYERDPQTVTFTPKTDLGSRSFAKNMEGTETDEDGNVIMVYRIVASVASNNTYTLDNVEITDGFNLTDQNTSTRTDAKYLKYISYIEDSFELYDGYQSYSSRDSTKKLTMNDPTITDDSSNLSVGSDSDVASSSSRKEFSVNVGDMEPGKVLTLFYKVKVDPGAFSYGENVPIKNRIKMKVGTDPYQIGLTGNTYTMSKKIWERKLAGVKQSEDTVVTVDDSDEVYSTDGTKISNPPDTFTIPAGAYKYQVLVNEVGDWDVSGAQFNDALQGNVMKYTQYLKIDAYDIHGVDEHVSVNDNKLVEDATAIANVEAGTKVKTVWVDVDGGTSFQFSPSSVGLSGNCAYVLTYYTVAENMSAASVRVGNSFNISGTVGIGGTYYTYNGSAVSVTTTATDNSNFSTQKLGWYYEEGAQGLDEGDDWYNGSLYWVIRMDGNYLPADVSVLDTPVNGIRSDDARNNSNTRTITNKLHADSYIGAYKGILGTDSITDIADLSALEADNRLTKMDDDRFEVTVNDNTMQITLNDKEELAAGESVYIIVKTEPGANTMPITNRGVSRFKNSLSYGFGDDWLPTNVDAEVDVYGSEGIFKELGTVFSYDGTTVTSYETVGGGIRDDNGKGGTTGEINASLLKDADGNAVPGIYLVWEVHLNYNSELEGNYMVEENIPDGTELAYVRTFWFGYDIQNHVNTIFSDELAPLPVPTVPTLDLGSEWTHYANGSGDYRINYYANGQSVKWEVDNLSKSLLADNSAVEYQVVCRVTDPSVLEGAETKQFTNMVKLETVDGEELSRNYNSVTIPGEQTITKESIRQGTDANRYPFKITINPLGEDLFPYADEITLVDELGDSLSLDITSLKIVDSSGAELSASEYTPRMEDNTLYLTIPDDRKLTITYTAIVNAAPGEEVSISNVAHWEGYQSTEGSVHTVSNFKWNAGIGVTLGGDPIMTVVKCDESDTTKRLEGATFELQSGTFEDGEFVLDTGSGKEDFTGTTDENGTVTFGSTASLLQNNTIYRLTETSAPEGYSVDTDPYYFVIAKPDSDGNYQEFPEGVEVFYVGPYTITWTDHKGQLQIEKKFLDMSGNEVDKVDGTYRFGVFDNEAGTGTPVEIATINYSDGTVSPKTGIAKISSLTLGQNYWIYELDDNDKPIKNGGSGYVNENSVRVTYDNGSGGANFVNIDSDAVKVTVTNQSVGYELPSAGGYGTLQYTLGGIFVLMIGIFYGCSLHRKMRGAK
jgi:hypothetical protein